MKALTNESVLPSSNQKTICRIGYDTIRIYTYGAENFYGHIRHQIELVQGMKLKIDRKSECRKYVTAASVIYRNAKIRFGFHRMNFNISFEPAKFFYDDNLHLAGLNEVRDAILIVTGLIQIPIDRFKFSRLDLTANFIIDEWIGSYTDRFKSPPYMKFKKIYPSKNGIPNGNVFYARQRRGSNRSVMVYKKKGMMRIEVKILKEIKRFVKVNFKCENKASTLFDKGFFIMITAYYADIVRKMCKDAPKYLETILSQLNDYQLKADNEVTKLKVYRFEPQEIVEQVA